MALPNFLEKMNKQNFGKKAFFFTLIAIAISLFVKLFWVPKNVELLSNAFFIKFKFWIKVVENIAMLNIAAFFICLIAFKQKIGFTIIQAMQGQNTTNKWIPFWLQTILYSLIILGITTFITHTLFKSWVQYFLLIALIVVPFLLKNKLQNVQKSRNSY
jgi:hypothetical protein